VKVVSKLHQTCRPLATDKVVIQKIFNSQ